MKLISPWSVTSLSVSSIVSSTWTWVVVARGSYSLSPPHPPDKSSMLSRPAMCVSLSSSSSLSSLCSAASPSCSRYSSRMNSIACSTS